MALRQEAWLSKQHGARAEVWLTQQMAYDIWPARQKRPPEIVHIPGD